MPVKSSPSAFDGPKRETICTAVSPKAVPIVLALGHSIASWYGRTMACETIDQPVSRWSAE